MIGLAVIFRRCVECGCIIRAKARKDIKVCSDACRMRAYRKRRIAMLSVVALTALLLVPVNGMAQGSLNRLEPHRTCLTEIVRSEIQLGLNLFRIAEEYSGQVTSNGYKARVISNVIKETLKSFSDAFEIDMGC